MNTAYYLKSRRLLVCCGLVFAVGGVAAAVEPVPRAARPNGSAQELHAQGVVVGDEAFLVMPDESTLDPASGRTRGFNLFRYRDGSDPVPVLTRSDAGKYLSGKVTYDATSGRFATATQPAGGRVEHSIPNRPANKLPPWAIVGRQLNLQNA